MTKTWSEGLNPMDEKELCPIMLPKRGVKKGKFKMAFAMKGGEGGGTMGEQWLLKQFSLNHPVEHIQKPKLPKLYVRVETSTSYFIIHNQFVK